jgi:hypothetical protein
MKLNKILKKALIKLNLKKRTIYRRDNEPYLTRYYIFRKPVKWMPSMYIHCFHRGDQDKELHSHPWLYSVSLILSGSYIEEYRKGDEVNVRTLKPGNLNFIKGNKFHRVDLVDSEVWTLFISGPKVQDWGFWNRITKKYIQWELFEQLKNKENINK